MTDSFINAHPWPRRAHVRLVVAIAVLAVSAITVLALVMRGGDAQANGSAKYDFRVVPRVGTPTTTFRVTFTAPFRADGEQSNYALDGVGPPRCPSIYKLGIGPTRRGDRVVLKLTPSDTLWFGSHRRWCRGAYVGYVYYGAPGTDDKFIGYFSFGVGQSPVSLEP